MKKVLFVCHGNIHRSAIAEQMLKEYAAMIGVASRIKVWSRGLQGFNGRTPPRFPNLRDYPLEWEASRDTLEDLGLSLAEHVATPISAADVGEADIVIAMDEKVREELLREFREDADKIQLFGEQYGLVIEDMGGKGDRQAHRRIILKIHAGVAMLLGELHREV